MTTKILDATFEADLEALRAGTLTFTLFANRHRDRFAQWAMWVARRRRATRLLRAIGLEDLVQVSLLACWRAVDGFRSELARRDGSAVTLVAHVSWMVGRRIELELERESGWARKGRRPPARAIPLPPRAMRDMQVTTPNESSRLYVAIAERRDDNLALDVVRGVSGGFLVAEIARAIYADPDRRRAYRLNSARHARFVTAKKLNSIGKFLFGG